MAKLIVDTLNPRQRRISIRFRPKRSEKGPNTNAEKAAAKGYIETNRPPFSGARPVAREMLAVNGTTIRCSEKTRKLIKKRGKVKSHIVSFEPSLVALVVFI